MAKDAANELAEIVKPVRKVWTVSKIADELLVARSTVYRWIAGESIPDAEQDAWLRTNVGIKGRWRK